MLHQDDTASSVRDGEGTIPCVDEPMLPVDNGDDSSMMPVDKEENQIHVVDVAPCEDDESMLPVDNAEDEPDVAAAALWLPDLPIRDILSRVPPSSVTRFKVVCKRWHAMITDDSYARTHRAAPTRSILLCDGDAPSPVTVVDESGAAARLALHPWRGSPRHGFAVQNCCGALACLRRGGRDVELLNPATGETLPLGHFFRHGPRSTWTPAAEHLPWYCLGRCAGGAGEYKVVHLDVRLPPFRQPLVTCEVLALGRESSIWDSSECFTPPEWEKVGALHVDYCPTGPGVHVAGVVHYLAWLVTGLAVVCFDLTTHGLSDMDLPPAAEAAVASLSELDGQLCLSVVVPGGEDGRRGATGAAMDIYVRGGEAWVKVCMLELDVAARRVPRPLLRRGSRMLMKRADGSLCCYDMDGAGGEGEAAGEEVVYESEGSRRRKQELSGVTADVFAKSPLPLEAILRGAGA